MIVLQLHRVAKSFGANDIFKDISLSINEGEKLALIGTNGSGKTTLLRCITGQIKPDAGDIVKKANVTIGYLEQMIDPAPDTLVWDVVMSSFTSILQTRQKLLDMERRMADLTGDALQKLIDEYAKVTEIYEKSDGYQCESLAKKILTGMGFYEGDFYRQLSTFSGGQKARIYLARLLALRPEILLLDEPTNHLDMISVEWLESYLSSYPGTIIVVSHDRMFLDKIATRVAEIRGERIISFDGNYSAYLEKRQAADIALKRAYEKQQDRIKATEAYIRRYSAGIKSKQARGRQSQLDRLERLSAPQNNRTWNSKPIKLKNESGQEVLLLEGISKYLSNKKILDKIDLQIRRGEKIALIGANGCGKTTLLKIIIGMLPADEGSIKIGSNVDIGYFSQEHENLNRDSSILEEIINNFTITLEEARLFLGAMLFSGDDVFKRIEDLSGGEQGRLTLLKLMLSGANFLILDEPTNHLDIDSRQATAEMLSDFPGTILFVSHDRYFIDYIADQTLVLTEGRIIRYWGNYSYYAEKRQDMDYSCDKLNKARKNQASPEQQQRLKQKELDKQRRQIKRAIENLEENITFMEEQQQKLEILLSKQETYQNEQSSTDLPTEYQMISIRLEESIQEWERLNKKLLTLQGN